MPYGYSVFGPVKTYLKTTNYIPKSVSHKIIRKIERVDRSILNKKETFCLDLFLFSYYAGGMSPIDVCLLECDRIKDDTIIYERIKSNKLVRVIIIDKVDELIEKYREDRFMNYVFPVMRKRIMTQTQIYTRVTSVSIAVNKVLKKICCELDIREHVVWSSARSSYISKMIDEGYHPLQIAQQTGNYPTTIYNHYYAITDREEFRNKINKAFGE